MEPCICTSCQGTFIPPWAYDSICADCRRHAAASTSYKWGFEAGEAYKKGDLKTYREISTQQEKLTQALALEEERQARLAETTPKDCSECGQTQTPHDPDDYICIYCRDEISP